MSWDFLSTTAKDNLAILANAGAERLADKINPADRYTVPDAGGVAVPAGTVAPVSVVKPQPSDPSPGNVIIGGVPVNKTLLVISGAAFGAALLIKLLK